MNTENMCPVCKPALRGRPDATPCVLHGGDPATSADPTNGPVYAVETAGGLISRPRPVGGVAFYWTNDWNDQGTAMRNECQLKAVGSREEAMREAAIDWVTRCDLVPGDCIEVDRIDDGGCWAEVPRDWTRALIEGFLADHGIDAADYVLRHDHPGRGGVVWVSVTACVYAASTG